MNKKILSLFAVTSLFVLSATSVYAGGTDQYGAGGCTPVYGGGSNCPRPGQVLIDKTVLNPATNIFVDNLGPNDPKYKPEQVVTFRLTVKNPGDETIGHINVSDKLPDFIDYMSGPGSYDSKTRTINFSIDNLAGGDSQNYEIKARTVHVVALPKDKNIICPVNVVDAVSDNQKDHDESQFCIEKTSEVKKVPSAGAEMLVIPALTTALGMGVYLKKKTITK